MKMMEIVFFIQLYRSSASWFVGGQKGPYLDKRVELGEDYSVGCYCVNSIYLFGFT